jgi:biopolymer transport protein ExbD
MNRIPVVCLVAMTLIVSCITSAAAQSSPALQRGISVQMAHTNNATAIPEADNSDAWIITVAADGSLYFAADPMTPESLADWMKTHPRHREAKLYIKADARVPFTRVEQVLEIGRQAMFETPVLLTSQKEPTAPGTMLPPNGLEVVIGSAAPAGSVATVVQLLNSGQQRPLLRVNGDEISWSALQRTLTQHFQKGDEKVVLLKADARLPFGQVAQIIDVCRSTGAKVFLPTPGL